MPEKYFEAICPVMAIDFAPKLETLELLPKVATAVQSRFNANHWGAGSANYLLRNTTDNVLFGLNFRRLMYHALDYNKWLRRTDSIYSIVSSALSILNVKKVDRIGYKIWCYLQIGMSSEEMSDLFFGTMLPTPESLSDIIKEPYDGLIHLYGKNDGYDNVIIACPMTPENALNQVNMNLEHLDKFFDSQTSAFDHVDYKRKFNKSCFYIDIDVYKHDLDATSVDKFLKEAPVTALAVANRLLAKLQSIEPRKGK